MRKDIRESVGLGSPPTIYTTNGSESINAAIKRKVNYKESEWPQFNDQMKEFATHQQEEIIRSLSGRGQYRLKPEFSHYGVSNLEWLKMRSDQRRALVANFEKAVIPRSNGSRTQKSQSPAAAVSHERINGLSISAEDSGITLIPLTTLNGKWLKASKLLADTNAITRAPGASDKACMVLSYTQSHPHMITVKGASQYCCDDTCIEWEFVHTL